MAPLPPAGVMCIAFTTV